MLSLPFPLLFVFLLFILLSPPLAAVVLRGGSGGRGGGGAVRVGGGGVLEQLLELLDPGFFFIPLVFSNQVVHGIFMGHSELLQFLIAFNEEGTLLVSSTVAVTLAPPALHHFHLLPQWHPQTFGGRVCQEAPGFFISWLCRNTVLWFVFMLLNKSWWRFLVECLDVFEFLDFLGEFLHVFLVFLHLVFGSLVFLVFTSLSSVLLSGMFSVRHRANASELSPLGNINRWLTQHIEALLFACGGFEKKCSPRR